MNIKIIFPLILFFTLTGCSTIGDIKSWAFDEDQEQLETVITNENQSQFEYVTVNIKDKIAV